MLFFPQKPLIKTQIVYMEFQRAKRQQTAAKIGVIIP